MALGDGIRRDIAKVSDEERDRFIAAIVKLDTTKFFPDGVSYWDKQEDIHKNAHFHGVDVHAGPAFIAWHRVIVNRLEGLLREVDPALSLHYWDWTTDPRSGAGGRAQLFTDVFMDNASGDVSHLLNNFESTEDAEIGNGHTKVWRDVGGVAANGDGTPALASDASILNHGDFATFGAALKSAHDNTAHSYIGGTLSNPHYSFHDPFVFLLHSNLDRLWARWQTDPAHPERLAPNTAYAGLSPSDMTTLATEHVEPWAGGTGLEPWASDPTKRAVITYTDLSVVTPPCYDTNSASFQVVEAENPFNGATSRYTLNFNDVPEEETTWRAAVLRVRSCGDVTMRVKPGTDPAAPFATVTPSVLTHEGPQPFRDMYLWFQFTAGALGTAPQTLGPATTTIKCDENGQEFQFELRANTIKRPTVAVQLALDQSGSMNDPAGTTGTTRLQVLKDASALFAQLIQKGNGIGIIRFDDDAYPPNDPTYGGLAIATVANDGFGDMTRQNALNAIAAHGAHGSTSVGDGVAMARTQLNGVPANTYDDKAIIVLTDGLENTPAWIADVMGSVDDRTFAVGLGNETQVNTAALTALSGSTGGYLLLSGLLSSSLDDQFRLRKFFLQILAGVTKTSIVRDPTGYVGVASRVKIPFDLTESDINCRVILLTDLPLLRLSVETPSGQIIEDANAASFGTAFDHAAKVTTSRFGLPVAFQAQKIHAGRWHAVLEIAQQTPAGAGTNLEGGASNAAAEIKSKGVKYCLSVHAFSNLRMTAGVTQSGFVPGSTLFLSAALTEYAVPLAYRADVTAQIHYPDHTAHDLPLAETRPGVFTGSLTATQSGVYTIRFLAEGGTSRGTPFTREQLATAAVWAGGDRPVDHPPTDPSGGDTVGIDWCAFLSCVLSERNVSRELEDQLQKQGINLKGIRDCVKRACRMKR